MTIKKSVIALAAVAALSITASARDQIRVVGSSTVYPFSSAVRSEERRVVKECRSGGAADH